MKLTMYLFSFAIGSAIGSFLNVCIYRLPREMSVVMPPSHCPNCGQFLAWFDNVPILSYLLLGGKCRHCGVIISGRYALVELLTGLMFAGTIWRFSGVDGFAGAQAAVAIIVTAALLAASFIDIERQIIPDEITLPGILLGCIAGLALPRIHEVFDPVLGYDFVLGSVAKAVNPHLFGLIASVFGGAVGAGFIYLTGLAGRLIFRKEAMGLGDVKLMALVGAFVGWRNVLLAIFLACLFGAVIGSIILIARRRKDTRIPFGPYLALGAVSVVFFKAQIIFCWQNWIGSLTAGA